LPRPPFAINLSTACLAPLSLATILRLAAEAGYDGLELVLSPEIERLGTDRVLALASQHALRVHTVHQPLIAWGRSRRLTARAEAAVQMALGLQCDAAVIHAPHAYHYGDPWVREWTAVVERCVRLTQGTSTRIALENPPYAAHAGRLPILSEPLELAGFAREHGLAVTYDTCHAGTAGLDLMAAYEALREHLANVHLSDMRAPWHRLAKGRLASIWTDHQIPGAGELALCDLLQRLARDGYTGPVTVEVNPVVIGNVWSPLRRRNLHRIVAFVREAGSRAR
jgi:sugar phosphate isomerase/epimerase